MEVLSSSGGAKMDIFNGYTSDLGNSDLCEALHYIESSVADGNETFVSGRYESHQSEIFPLIALIKFIILCLKAIWTIL